MYKWNGEVGNLEIIIPDSIAFRIDSEKASVKMVVHFYALKYEFFCGYSIKNKLTTYNSLLCQFLC